MNNKLHQIGKQIFEVEYASDANALKFRQEFTELVKRLLLATIEELLDELDQKNAVIRLEKVEIELEKVSYPFDEWGLRNQLRKHLKKELNFRIISIRHRQKSPMHSGDLLLENRKSEEELLLYFIQYGVLPWWSSETNGYKVSIEDRIQKIARSDPKIIVGILKKTANNSGQIRRFLSHFPEAVFVDFIASVSGTSYERLKELKEAFQQINLPIQIKEFDIVWNEFLVVYFVFGKKINQAVTTIQLDFIEYLLHQQYVYKHQLPDLFPEYFILSWLKNHFHEKYTLFVNELKKIQIPMDVSVRLEKYQDIVKSLLSSKMHKGKQYETISVAKEILNGVFYKPEVSMEISNSLLTRPYENKKNPKAYYNSIAEKIFSYLLYGVLSWEERYAGVSAIEAFIVKLHHEHPEGIKKLVAQIERRNYPVVLNRVEKDFERYVSDIFFKHYFQRETALKVFVSRGYRDKVLKTFFEKGIVPWEEVIGNTIRQVETIIRSFYDQDPEYFKKLLAAFLKSNPGFIDRIETLYSVDFTIFIKQLMGPDISELEFKKEIIRYVHEIPPPDVDLIIYYLSYYQHHQVFPAELNVTLQSLVEFFIERFPEKAKIYFTLAAYRNYAIIRQKFSPPVLVKINKWILPEHPEKGGRKELLKNKQHNSAESISLEIKEPIYITNAGLVLIHPFLQRFFSLSDLLEKRKFNETESAHKAVHLLHYIVFGSEKPEEHQLALNKILCGIPLWEPIDRTIELTGQDKETCESLIKGVIENWPILKKTSNENFRVSLLQREGRLIREEGSWRLKVEERSYDMLLDRLPWSISMIKLPWMEKMLQVDWH